MSSSSACPRCLYLAFSFQSLKSNEPAFANSLSMARLSSNFGFNPLINSNVVRLWVFKNLLISPTLLILFNYFCFNKMGGEDKYWCNSLFLTQILRYTRQVKSSVVPAMLAQ